MREFVGSRKGRMIYYVTVSGLGWGMTWAAFTVSAISASCYLLALIIYKPPPSESKERQGNCHSAKPGEHDEKHEDSSMFLESQEQRTEHETGVVNEAVAVDEHSIETSDGVIVFNTYL